MTERTVCRDLERALIEAMGEGEIRQCIVWLEDRAGDGPEFLLDALKAALERMQGVSR